MSREGAADTKYRMSAYYYSFRPTGVPEIDNILNAIAWAGKAFHHTEHWTEEISPYPECEGESCCDWIQNAADKAAKALDAAYAAGLREAEAWLKDFIEWNACNEFEPGRYRCNQCYGEHKGDGSDPHDSDCEIVTAKALIERLAQQAEGGADEVDE